MNIYRVLRTDRAHIKDLPVKVGSYVYDGMDAYGCADDDSRRTGVDHVSLSLNQTGIPFFTIPKKDVLRL